jgi:hypothetical protein
MSWRKNSVAALGGSLLLAMANTGTHTAFLTTNLATPFARLLYTHNYFPLLD